MSKKTWPCVLVRGSCGDHVWLCSRWPLAENDAKQWIAQKQAEHEANTQMMKGKFISECVSHAGFMDYLRANPKMPSPRVWISNK